MFKHASLFCLFICLGLFSNDAYASQNSKSQSTILYLNNGDRLSGQVVLNYDNGDILFKMDAGPEIRLPASILSEKAQINTDLKAQAVLPESQEDKVPPVAAANTPEYPNAQQLSNIEPSAPAVVHPFSWGGRVEVGGELQSGNSETQAILLDVRLQAREGKNRYQADFDFERSEDEDVVTDDNKELRLEYERFQTKRWFVGADATFENDDVAELDLRSRVGLNTGYQFYEQDDLKLKANAGLAYLNENFANQSTDTSLALTQATDYEQSFLDEHFRLFYEHDLLLPTDQFDAFIFDSEGGVRVPVAKSLIGSASVEFDWDNDPAQGVKEEDITYKISVGYEF